MVSEVSYFQRLLKEYGIGQSEPTGGYIGYHTWKALGEPDGWQVWYGDQWVNAEALKGDDVDG